jgi:hypothetical protein
MSLSNLLEIQLSGRVPCGLPCINGELPIYRCLVSAMGGLTGGVGMRGFSNSAKTDCLNQCVLGLVTQNQGYNNSRAEIRQKQRTRQPHQSPHLSRRNPWKISQSRRVVGRSEQGVTATEAITECLKAVSKSALAGSVWAGRNAQIAIKCWSFIPAEGCRRLLGGIKKCL